MIAVHPAYWRRGNGTLLLRWTAKLADADHIPLGIASVPMGIKISRNVGFEKKEEIDVKGYSEHPENFMVWIGVREPGALPSIPKSHETWASWMFNTVTAFFWKRDR
jgi:GNAT superfamily N-acetyltransferase